MPVMIRAITLSLSCVSRRQCRAKSLFRAIRVRGVQVFALIALLADKSLRVRSLAAIALGRVGERGDEEVIASLYQTAVANAVEKTINEPVKALIDPK